MAVDSEGIAVERVLLKPARTGETHMTPSRTRPRLLHTIVAMGVALTGGASAACGGIANAGLLSGSDGGEDADAAYPLIDAGGDQYATIGYIGSDADRDGYATIRPADAYPTIDVRADHYPTIGYDAGSDDGYPTIGIEADGYPVIH